MNFRRSLMRLLFLTAFLLFIAWVGLKLMTYRGDWEAAIRDLTDWIAPIRRFFEDKIEPMFQRLVEGLGNRQ